ncbi:hypothetical protein LI90_322 [Carbonactinospora thermoautotrophica]|uniref:DUF6571 domain-containing protein n=1 Tax=Carbonactinospora thermoautotrophica TaxID=1469144 RepID=A0A132MLF6_9ACTN|nr:hypothetical protein LI90_322 [Carbonactinospora thermoautotrophica]
MWDAELGPLREAAEVWTKTAYQLQELGERFARDTVKAVRDSGWDGPAAIRAFARLGYVQQQLQAAHAETAAIAAQLREATHDFEVAYQNLRAVVEEVVAAGLKVDDHGRVQPPPLDPKASEADKHRYQRLTELAEEFQRRVNTEVQRATDADERVAYVLRRDVGGDRATFHAGAEDAGPAADARRVLELMRKQPPQPGDLEVLQSLLAANCGNPEFATVLFNELGPKGTLEYLGDQVYLAAATGTSDQTRRLLRDIHADLGRALATATRHHHLDARWTQELKRLGREKIDIGMLDYRPYGYQLLGNLLRHGGYDAAFLTDVGRDILAFEKEHRGNGRIWEANQSPLHGMRLNLGDGGLGYDPVAGLMEALSHSPAAAEDFLRPNTGNLDYLLKDRRWMPDAGIEQAKDANADNNLGRDALGRAIEAATRSHSEASAEITAKTVQILAEQRHVPENMRDSIGHMLAQHVTDVNDCFAGISERSKNHDFLAREAAPGEHRARFNRNQLALIMSQVARDPEAHVAMSNAQYAYTAVTFNEIAASGGDLDERRQAIVDHGKTSAQVFGVLDQAYAEARKANQEEFDAKHNAALERNGIVTKYLAEVALSQVRGSDLVKPAVGILVDEIVKRMRQDTSADAARDIAEIYGNGRDRVPELAQEVMWNHGMWDREQGDPPSILLKDGKPIPPSQWNQDQATAYENWLGEKKEAGKRSALRVRKSERATVPAGTGRPKHRGNCDGHHETSGLRSPGPMRRVHPGRMPGRRPARPDEGHSSRLLRRRTAYPHGPRPRARGEREIFQSPRGREAEISFHGMRSGGPPAFSQA